MRTPLKVLCIAGWMLVATQALAEVTATEAWVRATVPKQSATGAFMKLTSTTDVALVAAESPVAGIVEVHQMVMSGNVMAMRAIDELPLPTGKTVELKPGGYHVMLMALKAPLKEGYAVQVTLTFKDRDGRESAVVVNAPVKSLTAAPTPAHGKH